MKNVQLLAWKSPIDDTITVLDGNDDGRELMDSISSNDFSDYPDDCEAYNSGSGLFVIVADYNDDEFEELETGYTRPLSAIEWKRLQDSKDVLMNV